MSNTYAGVETGGIGYLIDKEKIGVYAGYVFLPEDHPIHDKLSFNPKTLNVYGVECEPTGLGLVGEHPKFGVTVDQINLDPSLFNKNVAILRDAFGDTFDKFSVFQVVNTRGYRVTSQIVRKIASDLSPTRLNKPVPKPIDYNKTYNQNALDRSAAKLKARERETLKVIFDHSNHALVEYDGIFLALIDIRDLISISNGVVLFDSTRESYPGSHELTINAEHTRYKVIISQEDHIGMIELKIHK